MRSTRWNANGSKSVMFMDLWTIGLPTIIEQILQTIVQYVDTAMVGHIGADASAAVGLTMTVCWVFYGCMYAFSLGLLSWISRFNGEERPDLAHRTSVQSIWILAVFGVIETIVALSISGPLPKWMGGDPNLYADASAYFFIVSTPMIFRGAIILFGNCLRANKDMKTPMATNIVVNVLNIILNQLLIGAYTEFTIAGHLIHIPGAGMGVRGAAVATASSVVVGGIIMTLAWIRNPMTTPKGMEIKLDKPIMKEVIDVSIPLFGERIVMGMGYVVFAALIAAIDIVSLATHTIILNMEEIFYAPGYGIQTAVSTLTGNAAGRKNEREISQVTIVGLMFSLSIIVAMCAGVLYMAEPIMRIFSIDERVVALGVRVMPVLIISEPVFATLVIFEGVFRGMGETRVPFLISLFTMWGIRIFSTYIVTRYFNGDLISVWICMNLDNAVRAALLITWYKMKKWKKRLNMT